MAAQSASRGTGVAGPAGLADHLHFTFEDPLSSLPETARNLLIAAKDILAEEGFEALTLKTVSERAGENKAMVSYYFDNKAGLVAAVLDSVIHDEYLSSLDRMKDVAPGERIPRLVDEMRRMAESAEDFTVFYELLPHVLRDDVLRRRLAMLFRWYWKMKLDWLGVRDEAASLADPGLLGIAQLLSAVIDGLAIQVAVDPGVDHSNSYRVLARMLESLEVALPES